MYLFIWLHWVLVVAHRIFAASRGSFFVMCGLNCACFSSCGVQACLSRSMWDLSWPTKDQSCMPCVARQVLNHWTTREVLWYLNFCIHIFQREVETQMKQMLCCASYRLCQVKFACNTISFHTIHTQQKLLENYYLREYDDSLSWFHRRKSNWKFKNKREISVRNLSVSSLFAKFSGMASDIPTPLLWFRSLQSQSQRGTSLFKAFKRPYYF